MKSSIILASVLSAVTIMAAPAPVALSVDAATPGQVSSVSEYFNALAVKVQEGRMAGFAAPGCDLSKAKIPIAPIPLPVPSGKLKHVAIGRGTQNYTCDTTNATAIPVQTGAVATLFNGSCVAAAYPDLLAMLPRMALQFRLTDVEQKLGPSNLAISGMHNFPNPTTPFFDLDRPNLSLGHASCTKANATAAPADAPKGLQGENSVPWLKLVTRQGSTGNLIEVYRLETAGGSAPATCTGQAAAFEVQYAAQYWFFET